MDNFDDFALKIGLDDKQKNLVKKYILGLMIDNLEAMKDEYVSEIVGVIENLSQGLEK